MVHMSSVFYKFSLVFFSAMCYIKKNVFTGYTVTILFFQITIQQILFRGIFTMKAPGDNCESAAGGFAFLCITKRVTVRELNSYFYLR